jgi:hypothetical protein
MKLRKHLAAFMRGWLPKEFSLPSYQRIRMIDHFMRLHFLRLAYGVTLVFLLVMPFGVYHSRVEPYIMGYLWGYNLPVGYVGLLLGIAAVLYPKLNNRRNSRFSSFMPLIGLLLLLSFFFSPKDYFINLINGTNFSSIQIDVDFAVGNSTVLGLSILSIAFGLVSFIRGWLPKEPNSARRTFRIKAPAIKLRRRKPLTMRERVVGGLGGAGGALVLMGILNYVLASWYPKSYIVAEEVVGWLLVSLAFFVWIIDKNKKSALNAFREEKIEP